MYTIHYGTNDKRVQYLMKSDKRLGELIQFIGDSELVVEENGYKCLVKYIVGQQISDKARETIWQRLCLFAGEVCPEIINSISDIDLRRLGLSGKKVNYIKILSNRIANHAIDLAEHKQMPNSEIIDDLTTLPGIGKWTAEMYLIFSLARQNVLSLSDGTIKRTIGWMYEFNTLPTSKDILDCFQLWREYATIVSIYLWKASELGLSKKPFERISVG